MAISKSDTTDNRTKGQIGESVACVDLTKRGYEIVARNYRKKWGELDIVAKKDNILNFFEVKSVVAGSAFRPEENVHAYKAIHLRRMIATYMAEMRCDESEQFMFHVICVYLDMDTRCAKTKWIKDVIL